MSVCLLTSVSSSTPWAAVTMPNRLEYAMRHGYTLHIANESYEQGVAQGHSLILDLLSRHDLVWAMDSDCLITDMRQRIEGVDGLGEHVTVCEEQITPDNRINGGSVVWRDTDLAFALLMESEKCVPTWRQCRYGWQTWIGDRADELAHVVTILPPRAFNSAEWEWGGGGCHWQPGDFVFHPCGLEHHRRADRLRQLLPEVVR